MKEHVEVEDVFCNRCGSSCKTDCGFEGLIECWFQSGYCSTAFGDRIEHEFSLCESCLKIIYADFKHSPIKEFD